MGRLKTLLIGLGVSSSSDLDLCLVVTVDVLDSVIPLMYMYFTDVLLQDARLREVGLGSDPPPRILNLLGTAGDTGDGWALPRADIAMSPCRAEGLGAVTVWRYRIWPLKVIGPMTL